jgi:predicted nucleotidyltransferase
MPILLARPERAIHAWKRKDWLLMPRRSPSSVRVCYPRYNQETLVALLRERVSALAAVLPLKRVALFGSWARGRATAFSDIDLLVIYADPPRENVYQLVRRSIKLRGLEPHIYSEQQAQQMQATLARMTRQGIVLFPSGDEENKPTSASTE